MHRFWRSTYVVQINTKLVFLLEAFGENKWFVLLMKDAYTSAHSCLSAGLFLLMDSEMEVIIFQRTSRDVLETTRLICEVEQSAAPVLERGPYKLYYLLRLLSSNSFNMVGEIRRLSFSFLFFSLLFFPFSPVYFCKWKYSHFEGSSVELENSLNLCAQWNLLKSFFPKILPHTLSPSHICCN